MNKQTYIGLVCKAAKEYSAFLLDRNILFVARNHKTGQYSYIEAGFEKRHFMHLTGLKSIPPITSEQFFDLCLKNRLRVADIRSFPTGQSKLKIDVLSNLMKLPYTAKMIGEFNGNGNLLVVEKIAGNVTGCMGFSTQDDLPYMIPKTILKVNSVQVVSETKQVLATYSKSFKNPFYPSQPLFVVKGLQGKELKWPPDIASKIAAMQIQNG